MSISGVPPAVRSGVGAVDVESLTCFATPGGEREHLLLIELLSREKPLFFHASECRVDRTWARPPPSRATGLKFGDQLIAVHGSLGENDEQNVIEIGRVLDAFANEAGEAASVALDQP